MNSFLKVSLIPVALLTLIVGPAASEEPTEKKAAPRYHVYAWNCSRSLRTVLETDNLREAFAAAQKARQEGRKAQIIDGPHASSFAVFGKPVAQEVYAQGCRGGIRMLTDAEQIAAALDADAKATPEQPSPYLIVTKY